MIKRWLPIVLALPMLVPVTGLADVTVEPAGMKVVWKSLKEEFGGFKTYNSSEGVYVTLGVRSGDKGIIGFDKEKSTLSISDGSNDLAGKFGHWNKISKDGTTMRVEVSSEKLPAAETSSLKLNGELLVTVASETQTVATKMREFKKGDKVEMTDGFEFEIDEIGKPEWGDDPLAVTLKWKRLIPELAAVRFFDAEGKEIESSAGGSSTMRVFGKTSNVSKSYNLKKKTDTFKIEMDLWMDKETVTIPVDLNIAIGGGQ